MKNIVKNATRHLVAKAYETFAKNKKVGGGGGPPPPPWGGGGGGEGVAVYKQRAALYYYKVGGSIYTYLTNQHTLVYLRCCICY